jgi:predicted transcriptional regulator
MEVLDKLFGSGARVKVMRFFLMSPQEVFMVKEVAKTTRLSRAKISREINLLKSIGFLEKGAREKKLTSGSGRKTKKRTRTKKEVGARLNHSFPYIRELNSLILETSSISRELLAKRFKKLGKKLGLIVLAGVFVGRPDKNSLDVLVVGDSIRKGSVEKILKKIESEIGRELNYALFSIDDFKYRWGMYDKFLHGIFDGEHDKLIDNIGV